MCKKLKEIHNLTPKDIFFKYNVKFEDRIDVKKLLGKMKIKYMCADFSQLEKDLYVAGNDAILGIASSSGDDLNIIYAEGLEENDVNYVLAHELGHCCMHLPPSAEFHVEMKTKRDIYSLNTPLYIFKRQKHIILKEKEADRFAADLLIPTCEFMNLLSSDKALTIESIAKYFSVPEHVVRVKVDAVGFN